MASRIPVSTAQMAPKVSTLSSSGIRAPLTLVDESDSEFSETHVTNSYYSGSESNDGFVSGESESDNEIVHFVKEFGVSKKPLVETPIGNVVQRSNSNSKIEFLGVPLLNIPPVRDISVLSSGNSSRNSLSRPYVTSFNEYDDNDDVSDEETLKEGDYVGISRPVVGSVTNKDVVGNAILGVSSVSVLSRPVALISGESEDDVSEGSVVIEDDGDGDADDDDVSGVVEVPIGLMQRINSAPKVRIVDFKEDRENESNYGSTIEGEDDEEMVINDDVLGIENEEELIQGDLSVIMSQNEGLDFDKGLSATTLVVNGEKDCISETSGDLGNVNTYKQEHDVTDDKSECIDSCNSGELTDLNKDSMSDLGESVGLEITDINEGDDVVLDQDFESCNEETKTKSESVDRAGCSCETVRLGSTDSSGGDSVVFDQDFESCNEETKIESEMEEVPSNHCPRFLEFPETITESVQVDTIDTVLGINQIDARQPVLLSTKLDKRNHSQAEIHEQLPLGAENVMFHSCSVVDGIEFEEASDFANGGDVLRDHLGELDGIIFRDACEDLETDSGENDGKIMIQSSLKALSDAYDGKFTTIDCVDILPLDRNSTDLTSLFHSTIPINAEFFSPLTSELEKECSEGDNENLEQIESIKEKYLWLLHKLGRSCGDFVGTELEEQTNFGFDFSMSILVIGKTGVGKSATINSIFGEKKAETNAFGPGTKCVKEIVATVNGLKVKVIDTPGLRTSRSDLSINRKILSSIKRTIKKSPPDVVLYVDRLDMQTCDFTDLPMFRLITAYLGSSIWRKTIIVLSHAASLPPDELFVDQRSSFIQKMIFRLYGDSMYPGNIVPVSLVENDSLYNAIEYGEKLLFLCYSMKILLELNSVVATNDILGSPDLSCIRWKDDIISGCNLQCHVGVGTNLKLQFATDLKEKPSGGFSIRTRGSDQLQVAVLSLLLVSKALSGNIFS